MEIIQTGGHCAFFEIKNSDEFYNYLFTLAEIYFGQLHFSATILIIAEHWMVIEAWQVQDLHRDLPKLVKNSGENYRYYFRRLPRFLEKNLIKKLDHQNFRLLSV
ncbi:MAG: hypothetical protein CTY10_07625 [Methylotenera sp.]|nr:MAG: hypothetical protein BVN34_10185 [Proteobacteria bacterium ST_bin12]PPD54487.1 MAG: hypothetical protein CTY10_07625 [Methylotenera sp.]